MPKSFTHRPDISRPPRQRGFTLVELLVAMLLGLVTVIVVAQVMLMAESRKRTTTSGSEANTTGAMALYTIERDARNAGFGMVPNLNALGCEIKAKYGSNPIRTFILAPVVITQGSDGAADTITFTASSKDGVPMPGQTSDSVKKNANQPVFFLKSAQGMSEGDLLIAIPPTPSNTDWCSVLQVTKDSGNNNGGGQGFGLNKINFNSGLSDWNHPSNDHFPDNGYPIGSTLLNMGGMSQRTYSINSNRLRLTWLDTSDGTDKARDLYANVIQLQAQYGVDENLNDNNVRVTSWTNTTPTTSAGWAAVKAIRVAVVARSDVFEKDIVSSAGTGNDFQTCRASDPRNICWAGGAIKLDTTSDWNHYRYRVYEAVLPIRNVIWQP